MSFRNRRITFLQVFDAVGRVALWLKSGPNVNGDGTAVARFYTNDPSETGPGEITAHMDAGRPALSMHSPNATGGRVNQSSLLLEGSAPSAPNARAKLTADIVDVGPSQVFRATVNLLGFLRVSDPIVNSAAPNWIAPTLTNSWANYGAGGYADAGYCQLPDSTVELKGLIKGGTVGAAGCFVLPAGMRPLDGHRMFIVSGANGAAVDVRVFTSGVVAVYALGAGATTASVSLSGIRFRP